MRFGSGRVESILSDLKYPFRQVGNTPGFSAVVVIILALGIGASSVFLRDRQMHFDAYPTLSRCSQPTWTQNRLGSKLPPLILRFAVVCNPHLRPSDTSGPRQIGGTACLAGLIWSGERSTSVSWRCFPLRRRKSRRFGRRQLKHLVARWDLESGGMGFAWNHALANLRYLAKSAVHLGEHGQTHLGVGSDLSHGWRLGSVWR